LNLKGVKLHQDQLAEELESFYGMLERSEVVWVNQPSPLGFGDAVRRAKAFIDEDFMVCAGPIPKSLYLAF
jgi:UTP--glucose-1-phosphate uridylyltransferase